MASNDVRDILNVSVSKEARPSKKAKISAQQKSQLAGLSKEVRGLMMGDGIAPIQVQEAQYKQKPKLLKKVRPWSRAPFRHPLRDDGLILRHWTFHHKEATQPGTPKSHGAPVTPADSKVEQDRDTQTPPNPDSEYRFVKYNVKPAVPQYDYQQYEANLQDDDWTKDETDYLMDLAKDLELRWIGIWDRYDYHPPTASQSAQGEEGSGDDAMAITTALKPRSMEDLKYRYYQVAAKMMAIHQPLASMSAIEFELYEKMLKFDPNRETTRKKLAVALMARTPEEIREEEILLGELKRIVDNESRFLEERRELYQRLDFPQSNGSISAYETSAGLTSLVMQLHSDRNKLKRRSIADGAGVAGGPNGSGGASGQQSSHGRQDSTTGAGGRGDQRGGTGSQQQGKPNKKGGSGGGAGGAGAHRRELTTRDEAKFGVTHHDRLTSGVSFRQGRVEKLVLAKSAAQAQKLHDALAELSVPVKAVMPTNRVCSEYERLITGIHALLDARKTSEKMANEIRVLTSQKETRERRERGEEEPAEEESKGEDGEKKAGEGTVNGDGQNKDDDDDADAEEDEEEMKRRGRRKEDEEDDEDEEKEGEEDEDEDEEGDGEVDASARADNEDEDDDDDNNESVAQADDQNEDDEEEGDGDGDDEGDVQADSDDEGREEQDDEDVDDGDIENDEEQAEADIDLSDDEQQDHDKEDDEEDNGDVDGDEDEGQNSDDNEEPPPPQPEPKSRKRSVSVLSAASQHSSKRTRR